MTTSAAIISNQNTLKSDLIDAFNKHGVTVKSFKEANYVVGVFKSYEDFFKLQINFDTLDKKFVVIFPLEIFDPKVFAKTTPASNLAIVYRQDLNLPKEDMEVGVGESFYPVNSSSVAEVVVKWTLAFGPFGKESFLLGNQVSAGTLWKEFKKHLPALVLYYERNKSFVKIPRGYQITRVDTNLEKLVQGLLPPKKVAKPDVKKKQTIKLSEFNFKFPQLPWAKFKWPVIVICVVLLIPLICGLTIMLLFYLSYRSLLAGKSNMARNLLLLAKTPAIVASAETQFLNRDLHYTFNALEKISGMGITGLHLMDSGRTLFDKILGEEIYDPENLTNTISKDLSLLIRQFQAFEKETKSAAEKGGFVANRVLSEINFEKLNQQMIGASRIADEAPALLGKDARKTYLLLFQNNMELRPTGGFIGSFGLLTLDGGRMSDLSVSDVYSADGQLKGHVEPPAAIREHLDEANWYLRDSNWDPDFSISAQKAEWFLDKEIGKEVDGVIGVDLNVAKEILKYTGPIRLVDYDMDITTDNLYLKTQEEVHQDFFPGTHKKASFLTALSRNLVTKTSKLGSRGEIGVLRELYENLEERHVQIFLHSASAQKAISDLMWSGEVKTPSCGEGCFADFVSVVEANVGVNKANYFIKRSYKLESHLSPNSITSDLTLTLKNEASPGLGLPGKYKVYIRVFTPNGEQNFIEEVINGESEEIKVSWETPVEEATSYGIYFRKQAGTGESDSLTVSIVASDAIYGYNTTLARDFLTKIPWTNIH